jgi:hypothetical protein
VLSAACPLYPQKQTLALHKSMSAKANSGHRIDYLTNSSRGVFYSRGSCACCSHSSNFSVEEFE